MGRPRLALERRPMTCNELQLAYEFAAKVLGGVGAFLIIMALLGALPWQRRD